MPGKNRTRYGQKLKASAAIASRDIRGRDRRHVPVSVIPRPFLDETAEIAVRPLEFSSQWR
jgi:hypothetical protein